jgi:peroxiredoxin Q/BCP
MKLKPGKKAPDFSALNQKEKLIDLATLTNKKLVLYFYPQDDTPTCTTEACNLRDNYKMLLKNGYNVVGISPDSVKKHQKFIAKYKLPFDLLSDENLVVAKKYGVWGEKTTFGRTYMGILRTTFIIDEHGIIEEIIEKVESKNHAEQILAAQK